MELSQIEYFRINIVSKPPYLEYDAPYYQKLTHYGIFIIFLEYQHIKFSGNLRQLEHTSNV